MRRPEAKFFGRTKHLTHAVTCAYNKFINVTDRQTDKRLSTAIPRFCVASHAR